MTATEEPLNKLTTILFVDAIEPCLPTWAALGYAVTARVPDEGTLGFVILSGASNEVMLQTLTSLGEDLPVVAELQPRFALYADVTSVTRTKSRIKGGRVLIPRRKTFYGATESWLQLADGTVLGLAQHD